MQDDRLSFNTEDWGDAEDDFEFDPLLDYLGDLLARKDQLPHAVNEPGLERLQTVYRLARQLARDSEGARVTYQVHEPFQWCGSVTITARSLNVKDMQLFNRIVKIVGNYDVSVKVNGTVVLDFTFDDLAVPVKPAAKQYPKRES